MGRFSVKNEPAHFACGAKVKRRPIFRWVIMAALEISQPTLGGETPVSG
jgi:hypothetical protein